MTVSDASRCQHYWVIRGQGDEAAVCRDCGSRRAFSAPPASDTLPPHRARGGEALIPSIEAVIVLESAIEEELTWFHRVSTGLRLQGAS